MPVGAKDLTWNFSATLTLKNKKFWNLSPAPKKPLTEIEP